MHIYRQSSQQFARNTSDLRKPRALNCKLHHQMAGVHYHVVCDPVHEGYHHDIVG